MKYKDLCDMPYSTQRVIYEAMNIYKCIRNSTIMMKETDGFTISKNGAEYQLLKRDKVALSLYLSILLYEGNVLQYHYLTEFLNLDMEEMKLLSEKEYNKYTTMASNKLLKELIFYHIIWME